jgi:acyl carrier protein phosphodiesterase
VKHITETELGRRIAVNYTERTATHQAMIGMPGCVPLVDPLSEEWAGLSRRYEALAAQSDELYAELERRANA